MSREYEEAWRKIPLEKHAEVLRLRREGMTLREIGEVFGVTHAAIFHICNRQNNLTGDDVWFPFHFKRFFWFVGAAARVAEAKAQIGDEHYPHGTVKGYRRGCKCQKCRLAMRHRGREWRQREAYPFPNPIQWKKDNE